ncbi:dihydrofolate reductase [Porphyromonas macacae]|uniref:2-hydroxyacid dehydrogenase SAV2305 n=1 Tax=Porphyromonas macacae TaxID=28115 RepID=A0A0A2EBB8_9PORP|nr:NAD(P)-dependent oxidoreductase [Porphyromonas macacae]KGN73729.1 dihydrofolate reductase [Porphyromonas macacae]SUB88162.1 Putative 2-hydroxyacid dehydrogenase SAV2305 [Porphyromonas macacae]
MAKILIAFDTVREGWDELMREHEVTFPPEGRDFTQDELKEMLPGYDVLCSVFDIPVRADLLEKGAKLKLVSNYAVGYNNIDLDYCKQHHIAVTNTPYSVIEPTAELVMALMLSVTRRVAELDRLIRTEGPKVTLSRIERLGVDLFGKTVGIVGYGNIGAAVARRCKAFGMKVLYNKRTRLSEREEINAGITYASLEELLQQSDIVSVHTPYSKETHHLINARTLRMMKEKAILINSSRGAVVDEQALVQALKSEYIAAAGLDVFENADVPVADLLKLDNVVMTPHVGTQTYDARVRMVYELVDNVLGFLQDDRKISRVV